MDHIALLVSAHRSLLMGIFALALWALANYWYLRGDIRNYRRARRPHNWSVDMVTKSSKGGRPGSH